MPTIIGPRNRQRLPPMREPGPLMAWFGRRFTPRSQEDKDHGAAERVTRLEAFVHGRPVPEVWPRDLGPIFEEAFDAAVHDTCEAVALGAEHALVAAARMKAISDLYRQIDAASDLSAGTAARLARTHMERQAAALAAEERNTG